MILDFCDFMGNWHKSVNYGWNIFGEFRKWGESRSHDSLCLNDLRILVSSEILTRLILFCSEGIYLSVRGDYLVLFGNERLVTLISNQGLSIASSSKSFHPSSYLKRWHPSSKTQYFVWEGIEHTSPKASNSWVLELSVTPWPWVAIVGFHLRKELYSCEMVKRIN